MSDETTTEVLAEIEGQADAITPSEVAAQQLVRGFVLQVAAAIAQQEAAEQPKPVQVCEGRWRTRRGEVVHVTPSPPGYGFRHIFPWHDARALPQELKNWRDDGHKINGPREHADDLVEYLGPIEQSEKVIMPDDVAGEALAGVWDQRQAERTIEDLQHRLDVVSAEWAEQAATINGLQQQLEAVKAELVQQAETSRRLQIELDAREQVPQAVSDRFEEGWDAGTARAVETIAEWLEPLRKGDTTLMAAVLYNLPHIMRSLTGLTPED